MRLHPMAVWKVKLELAAVVVVHQVHVVLCDRLGSKRAAITRLEELPGLLVRIPELVRVDAGELIGLVDNLDELLPQPQYLHGVATQHQQRG